MKKLLITLSLIFLGISGSYAVENVPIEKAEKYHFTAKSGDNQVQVTNKKTTDQLQVTVTGIDEKPIQNFPVNFTFLSVPQNATGQYIEHVNVLTDSVGIAATYIYTGSAEGKYLVYVSSNTEKVKPLVFTVNVRKPGWLIALFIGLIGGLGLFLYGMTIMSAGLQKSAGDKMRSILSKLTNNRFIAFVVGIFITVILQSSSATTVMMVGFVNSKLMKFRQTIGIFMGAAIGTTITAQIIAFNISEYSLLFVGLGFFIYFLSRKQVYKFGGEAILGFGILFFGMYTMSQAMTPLKNYEPFVNFLTILENPFLGVAVGMIATALIQSSGAFIGIMIVLANQGLLTLNASIPLLIGTNIGTTLTALLASIEGTRESKRVSVAFAIYKLAGVFILIWWISSFVKIIEYISPIDVVSPQSILDGIGRQIANAHTLYNLILAVVFLPLAGLFEKFINLIIPSRETHEAEFKTRYLDDSVLKTPSLALSLAKQETLRMMKLVEKMANIIITPFLEKNTAPLSKIEEYEKQVDFLRDRISDYVVKISRQDINSERIEEAFRVMFTVNEFEQMADIISTNLKEKAKEWCETGNNFSSEGRKELIQYHNYTIEQLKRAYELYDSFDIKEAREMKDKYKEYRKLSFEMEKQHFERLMNQVEESVSSSKMHMELITLLKLVASHATNTARILTAKQ